MNWLIDLIKGVGDRISNLESEPDYKTFSSVAAHMMGLS